MILGTPLLRLAQTVIRKDQLRDVNGLPTRFTGDNIQRGLVVAFGIAGGIAVIVVAYGGLRFVISQGNPQEVTKAKNTIVDGLIGLLVILGAGGIVGFAVSVLT
jgi:amino acid transporter